jgi:hypothetical protein
MKGIRVELSRAFAVVLVIGCMLCACSKRTAGVKDYLKYVNSDKSGLVQTKEMDGMFFRLKYMPPEWMALNELKKTSIDIEQWNQTLEEYQGLAYCKMTISCKDDEHIYSFLRGEGMDEQDVEAYFNYNAQHDFFMVSDADTSKCVLYSFSKTYGLASQFDIALAFEPAKDATAGDKVIEFDASLFNG